MPIILLRAVRSYNRRAALCGVALAVAFACAPGRVSSESISADDAVREALIASPRMRASRAEADAAQAQTERERPVAQPTLTAQAHGLLQGPRVTFPRGAAVDATVLPEQYGRLEISLEQTVYRPGLAAARTRYGASTRANGLQIDRAANDFALEVRQAFYGLVTAEAMAKVAHDGVDLARAHLDLVKLMLEAGQSAERDVKAGDADLAEAEEGAIKADNGIALARENLGRLLGRSPGASVRVTTPARLPEAPDSPDAGIALAIARRPEVRLLEEGLKAARSGVSLARTQSQPALAARATVARQTPSAFADRDYVSGGLVLTWNLLDAGKTRTDVREASARVSQLEALLDDARSGVRLDVDRAWRNMREATARIETARRQVASAEAAREVSELRYKVRQATQLEVSGALLGVTRARANLAQAISDLHLSAADYAHATGADAASTVR
jgi:outer membrane protein